MVDDNNPWIVVKDGDARARDIFDRHYSRRKYKDGRKPKLFVGPGEKMVLLTPNCDALFVWRKFIDDSGQRGINCAVFRNEGGRQSSQLVLWAEEMATQRWPGERLYTWVWDAKVKSVNPGYCFKMAGWRAIGRNKDGRLTLLEKLTAITTSDTTDAK